jgi:hypothetical protein
MDAAAVRPAIAVVKVGTSSITSEHGELDDAALRKLCGEIGAARAHGHEVVLVCSGAIAAGLPALGLSTRPTDVGTLQAIAAVGQPRLMQRIGAILAADDLAAGEILLTPHDFGVRSQYLHARETLRRLQLGLDNIPLPQRASVNIADAASDDPFRLAFIKIKTDQGLYREASNDVTFLTPALFRASIPLPAEVPVGTYEVDVRLFADGAQIARAPAPFEVYKSGFEQVVTNAARDHGLLYGLATAMMAIATGWFASIVFRRD